MEAFDAAMKIKLGSSSYDSPILIDEDDTNADIDEPITIPYTNDDGEEELPRREDGDLMHKAYKTFVNGAEEVILPTGGLYGFGKVIH